MAAYVDQNGYLVLIHTSGLHYASYGPCFPFTWTLPSAAPSLPSVRAYEADPW